MEKILKNPYRINILVEKSEYEKYREMRLFADVPSFSDWVRQNLDVYIEKWYPHFEGKYGKIIK